MARIHKARRLSAEARAWLEEAIAEDRYTLAELVTELQQRFGETLSVSAAHRYRQKIDRTLAAIRASTEAARLIAEAAPDDADEHSAAVIRIVQSSLFDALIKVREAEDVEPAEQVKLLSQAARAVAEASRASIAQKRWQDEVKAKIEAVEHAAQKSGRALDAATLAQIKEALYG